MKKDFIIFNTLTKTKEKFTPINEELISIYSCGPTVYSNPHIGNMRAYVFVDTLVNTLKIIGYNVKNVINITDVGHLTSDEDYGDDKLELAARKNKTSAYQVSNMYTEVFLQYLKELNIDLPSVLPKATNHIKEQIDMIKTLEKKGFTYKTIDGVYFNTKKFPKYNELSQINEDELISGIRVAVGEKKSATDFALWKFSLGSEKREMEWDSPWGVGFPGWHIECSAMAIKHLGEQIDIHTGGIDHINIHHSNEIAQSEAYSDKKFVKYWMHVNFLKLNKKDVVTDLDDKMSKSKGTAYTQEDLAKKGFSPLTLKYFYLTSHYRSQMKFDFDIIESVSKSLERLKKNIYEIRKRNLNYKFDKEIDINKSILLLMSNDLDTPRVLAIFNNIISGNYSDKYKLNAVSTIDLFFKLDLIKYKPIIEDIPENIIKLANERLQARNNFNWVLSDKLREDLLILGYIIKDENKSFIISKK